MQTFKRLTIGFKIISGLSVILLLVIGTSVVTFIMQKNRISDAIFTELMLVNNASRVVLLDVIDGMQRRAIDFSSDGFIRDATQEIVRTGNQETIDALGEHLRKNKLVLDPAMYGINILDRSSMVIASTDSHEIGKDGSHYVQKLQPEDFVYGAAQVSDFISTDSFGVSMVALAVAAPLTDKMTGEHIGTLVNFIEAGSIADALKIKNELLTGIDEHYAAMNLFLVNNDGYIIDSRYFNGARMTRQADVVTILKCSLQKSYENIQGINVIAAALCMENGWTLVTEVPEAEAMQSIEDTRKSLIYLAALLTALILFIIYAINKRVIDPIKALASAAKKLGEGDFDIRTHIITSDELGDLSDAFNDTAKKLKDSHVLLTKKIREVTEDFKKFKLAVDGTSDHIVITDTNGIILYANSAAELTTGYTHEEILGNTPALWGKQMPTDFYRTMWNTIKEQRKSFYGEITNKRKNGQIYIAEAHISPLFDEQGSLYGFVGVERDITRQKEVDKSKTEFVSVASHQLRTPLTIINWYIEMLSDPQSVTLSEKQKRYIEEIARASKRMIELVNALLNVSRIDMGTFMVDVEPIDFSLAMDDVLKDLFLQIARKDMRITKNYDETLPPISADPKLLRIIFQNLITNAVKYTQNGGSITISLSQKRSNILISVTDNGLGIPMHQQNKIFSKFFRADNAREKEPDGNGLGLYIVKSLVEHSGGKIWFTSEENKGTTFYVELPLSGMQAKKGSRPLAA